MNQSMAENFMRSANAPRMRAGVITAKVIWKVMKTVSGMVPLIASTVTPARNSLPNPPMKALPSSNAML